MSTCRYCDGEIIFRYIDGQVKPIHLSGSCSSYYGYSSYSGGPTIREAPSQLPVPIERASEGWTQGHARSDSGVPFTDPTTCPICGAFIFFHTNGNGDAVFFDELGPPWPKHPCLSSNEGRRTASRSRELMQLVDLYAPPRIIRHPMPTSPLFEDTPTAVRGGRALLPPLVGVVTRLADRTAWRGRADTYVRTRVTLTLIDLCLSQGRSAAINIPSTVKVPVGQVVRVYPVEDQIDGRNALYAQGLELVPFTGDFYDTDKSKATNTGAVGHPQTPSRALTVNVPAAQLGSSIALALRQQDAQPHALVKDLSDLPTGCPLTEVIAVVRTHVERTTVDPIDKELFPPLRAAFRSSFESNNLDLAAAWLLALELVPLTRGNAIHWRTKARRLIAQGSYATTSMPSLGS